MVRPLDDSRAREEWGWAPSYDLEKIVTAFLAKLSGVERTASEGKESESQGIMKQGLRGGRA